MFLFAGETTYKMIITQMFVISMYVHITILLYIWTF